VLVNGDMSNKAKDVAKRRFQTDPKCRLFLSSDAGGYGVDLPQAQYLISYDLPWSAGALAQRNARIIRLSSTFDTVTIFSLLMKGSIEERQYDMLAQKNLIASAVVDGKGADSDGRLVLNLSTLRTFLLGSDVGDGGPNRPAGGKQLISQGR
jgi:SNF2 family DNA or RNA helicase